MIGVRTFPGFMIAAAALFASMVLGAAALLIEKHNTVVYLPLAQGAIYAVFTFLLLREKHLVTGCPERRSDLGVPGALGRRKQRTGEIELHDPEYRGRPPVDA